MGWSCLASLVAMSDEPMAPEPDDKDWTFVLGQPCPDCGFDAAAVDRTEIPALVRSSATAFQTSLSLPGAATRPSPQIWSPHEYGCHVRDVCRIFAERLARMRDEDDPLFANWDQDATALEDRYWAQDPARVSGELTESSAAIAEAFAGIADDEWQRPGRRSNGSVFTVESLGRYFVHDLVHHVADISGVARH